MRSDLAAKLKSSDRLPSIPGVALEIVRLAQEPDLDVQELSDAVSRDPALTAKILRTANSAMFGLPREITNAHQAVLLLGMRSVNLLALSFSLAPVARGDGTKDFDYRRYWTQMAATTIVAHSLAKQHSPKLREEAFLGGLLCDLGQLVLAEALPDEYAQVIARTNGGEILQDAELHVFGTTHMEVARDLLDSWNLPKVLCEAIGAHHNPNSVRSESRALAEILCVATSCSEVFGKGDLECALSELTQLGARHFGLDRDGCGKLVAEVQERLPETARLFDLDADDPAALADIRQKATELLVRESLALNQQVQSVNRTVDRLEEEKTSLRIQASTDPLTGLGNRGFFDESLEHELECARTCGHGLGLLILDLDHFKRVNDSHGHPVGDELLRLVAATLREKIDKGHSAARYGGEELAVIVPSVARDELEKLAEDLRASIAKIEVPTTTEPAQVTASIGGYWLQRVGEEHSARHMIERADHELYEAKAAGRDQVRIATD